MICTTFKEVMPDIQTVGSKLGVHQIVHINLHFICKFDLKNNNFATSSVRIFAYFKFHNLNNNLPTRRRCLNRNSELRSVQYAIQRISYL